MLKYFGRKRGYEVVSELPKVGDVRNNLGEVHVCTEVYPTNFGEIRHQEYDEYAPYFAIWKDKETGEEFIERVCIEREEYSE